MLTMTSGGSSPTMANIEKGAALGTPSGPSVVTQAMGRGTMSEAISLYRSYGVRASKSSTSCMALHPPAEDDVTQRGLVVVAV